MSPTLIAGIIIVIMVVIIFIMLAVGASYKDDPWGQALLSGTIIGFIDGSILATAAGFIYWQRTMVSGHASGLIAKLAKYGSAEEEESSDSEDFKDFEELDYIETHDEKAIVAKFNELTHLLQCGEQIGKLDEVEQLITTHFDKFVDEAAKLENKAEARDLLDEIVNEKVLSAEVAEKLEKIRNALA